MGFFFQALQRATGTAGVETEAAPVQVAPVPAAAARETNVSDLMFQPERAKAAVAPAPKRQLHWVLPPEHLVAVLRPPVQESNLMAQEQCRILRTRLLDIIRTRKLRTLMVSSAMTGEGKTMIACNLAYMLSQLEDFKVLLVDADLRRPNIARFFKMDAAAGLNTVLMNGDAWEEVLWQVNPNLDVVPAVSHTQHSTDLLHGARMETFLRTVSELYDLVLLDAPPLYPVADAQVLAPQLDGAILVVRAHSTPVELAQQAAALLQKKLVGTVLNGAERIANQGYYQHYLRRGNKA